MRSKLQLDVVTTDPWRRHLVILANANEGKRQAWCCLQVKLCDPCLSALRTSYLSYRALYKSTYLYLLPFTEWCHFQWFWKNPHPVFKVTLFFDAEYLANGYRYGHSYYGRRI